MEPMCSKRPRALVFSGGAARGAYLVGALLAIEHQDATYSCASSYDAFAGSSIGALIGLMVSLGGASGLFGGLLCNLPAVFQPSFPLVCNGLSDLESSLTDYLEAQCKTLLPSFSRTVTFSELYEQTKKELYVTVSRLGSGVPVYCHRLSTPDWPVLKAVIASMSLPIFFRCVCMAPDFFALDGGLTDNFPVAAVSEAYETTGLLVDGVDPVVDMQTMSFPQFITLLLKTVVPSCRHRPPDHLITVLSTDVSPVPLLSLSLADFYKWFQEGFQQARQRLLEERSRAP
eukprot:gnl/Hemi2/26240_TR8809_c0_g2_i1.p1 gnl/Hemi2/26240_TR8809_c0_g2~~gnl/Hemi2/26240_TR8809_c0_g2_i1.p1  ORF type:complete len:287 (+),score=34.56 gnl/Hemi2/26240_TR8809_c0_g2_i1:891-1751(+)